MNGATLAILARGVHKSFGVGANRTPVLSGAGLGIQRGEVVFLVGPSGSGKTTLLSILGCILTPDGGSLQVLGREVAGMSVDELTAYRRQHLGFIFQTFNLFPTLSALDNVALSLVMRGVPQAVALERARSLLAQVGLEPRRDLRPAQLSTGECQRVAVARALANEPAILLADEPTASLDARNGQAVLTLLTGLVRERGVTLVVVTHDNRIFSYADRILHLENGRLIRASKPGAEANDLSHLQV
ncbi:MAG: ABC transporter ATP-binding protein [Planctomycetia bacterium]|nr:ABC transporter ATP-binding protein [Planctomycetia bacterium]